MAKYRRTQRKANRDQWGERSLSGRKITKTYRMSITVEMALNKLNQLYYSDTGKVSRGGNYVYVGHSRGRGVYVGISTNPKKRQGQHSSRFHLHTLNPHDPITRIGVRGLEQYLIEEGRRRRGNQNIANSIARHHTYYNAAITFGRRFVKDHIRRVSDSPLQRYGR